VTALLLLVGAVGSILAASTVTQNAAQRSHQHLTTSSTEIAATLNLAIEREQDLAVGSGAFVAGNPNASQADFLNWVSLDGAFQRYSDLQGIAYLQLVPADQLTAFAAREVLDPVGPLASDGSFQVVPGGLRPFYCLETGSESKNAAPAPAGVDYCDGPVGATLLRARDSGEGGYVPFRLGKRTELALGIPIYADGVVPQTLQARQAAFIGWTGIDILPSVLLDASLAGHSGVAVAFRYRSGGSSVTFRAGSAPAGAQSTTISLHHGWSVETFGAAPIRGLLGDPYAVVPLLAGILLSLLLATLIYLLGTSRSRAVELVSQRTDQLRYQALHDSLTGLPNRALTIDRIDQMLARARRLSTPVAAMFLDLDDFKDVNDTLGHTVGDQLLSGVGARLVGALRQGDTVGRLGGDEFVMLVEGDSLDRGPEIVAQRILEALEAPFDIPGSPALLSVTASIGVATGDRAAPEDLLRDADIALYRAKAAGKRRSVVFSPSMQVVVDGHRNLVVDLRHALDEHQFFLLYQPTVSLATGAITGVEALLRWRHPTRGVVMPDDFIAALESSGLIVPVGQWVLEEACRQGVMWHREGNPISVSANISIRQLERDRIVDDVHGALSASGLDPSKLILELTETTLMSDVAATVNRLQLLKALGVRLAIDDFGTGYSSLAYLQQFPIDVLKIDQSFVAGIARTTEAAALVHMFVQLGKALGLETIAEGIETDLQRVRLQAEKVDGGQGYLFARPMSAEAVGDLLRGAGDKSLKLVRADAGLKSPDSRPRVRDRRSFR
jgi:diguanylate cyclase (GGDEF)-like protein